MPNDIANNRNNYINNLKEVEKSLDLVQQKGNFSTTEILLMLLLHTMIDKALYELGKEQEE